jgi:uncharacterized membrane protein YgcG
MHTPLKTRRDHHDPGGGPVSSPASTEASALMSKSPGRRAISFGRTGIQARAAAHAAHATRFMAHAATHDSGGGGGSLASGPASPASTEFASAASSLQQSHQSHHSHHNLHPHQQQHQQQQQQAVAGGAVHALSAPVVTRTRGASVQFSPDLQAAPSSSASGRGSDPSSSAAASAAAAVSAVSAASAASAPAPVPAAVAATSSAGSSAAPSLVGSLPTGRKTLMDSRRKSLSAALEIPPMRQHARLSNVDVELTPTGSSHTHIPSSTTASNTSSASSASIGGSSSSSSSSSSGGSSVIVGSGGSNNTLVGHRAPAQQHSQQQHLFAEGSPGKSYPVPQHRRQGSNQSVHSANSGGSAEAAGGEPMPTAAAAAAAAATAPAVAISQGPTTTAALAAAAAWDEERFRLQEEVLETRRAAQAERAALMGQVKTLLVENVNLKRDLSAATRRAATADASCEAADPGQATRDIDAQIEAHNAVHPRSHGSHIAETARPGTAFALAWIRKHTPGASIAAAVELTREVDRLHHAIDEGGRRQREQRERFDRELKRIRIGQAAGTNGSSSKRSSSGGGGGGGGGGGAFSNGGGDDGDDQDDDGSNPLEREYLCAGCGAEAGPDYIDTLRDLEMTNQNLALELVTCVERHARESRSLTATHDAAADEATALKAALDTVRAQCADLEDQVSRMSTALRRRRADDHGDSAHGDGGCCNENCRADHNNNGGGKSNNNNGGGGSTMRRDDPAPSSNNHSNRAGAAKLPHSGKAHFSNTDLARLLHVGNGSAREASLSRGALRHELNERIRDLAEDLLLARGAHRGAEREFVGERTRHEAVVRRLRGALAEADARVSECQDAHRSEVAALVAGWERQYRGIDSAFRRLRERVARSAAAAAAAAAAAERDREMAGAAQVVGTAAIAEEDDVIVTGDLGIAPAPPLDST